MAGEVLSSQQLTVAYDYGQFYLVGDPHGCDPDDLAALLKTAVAGPRVAGSNQTVPRTSWARVGG